MSLSRIPVADTLENEYLLMMKLDEVQREAEHLPVADQRKLIGFLVAASLRRDETYLGELSRRLDDKDPQSWIKLNDVERALKSDGV